MTHKPSLPFRAKGFMFSPCYRTSTCPSSRKAVSASMRFLRTVAHRGDGFSKGATMKTGRKPKDLTGITFGRLTVIRKTESGANYQTRWVCACACGKEWIASTAHLKSGAVKSCGCYQRDVSSEVHSIHKSCGTREYRTWARMKFRCSPFNHEKAYNYLDRGITVCERWSNSFLNFLADMGKQPSGTTLERTDNAKGYEPGNCKWATTIEQANNKRTNRLVTIGSETKTVAQWIRQNGADHTQGRNVLKRKGEVEFARWLSDNGQAVKQEPVEAVQEEMAL